MSSNTIFSEEPRVNIPRSEYEELLEYKKICKDLFHLFRGDAEWLLLKSSTNPEYTPNVHSTMNVKDVGSTVKRWNNE